MCNGKCDPANCLYASDCPEHGIKAMSDALAGTEIGTKLDRIRRIISKPRPSVKVDEDADIIEVRGD